MSAGGFARIGALSVDSEITWAGGQLEGNLGTGVMISGGHASIDGVVIDGTLQGVSLVPTYGLVIAAGAIVETTGVEVSDGEGLGIIHDHASATHTDLVVRDNDDVGVWIQHSSGISLSGSASVLDGNLLAGLVAVDSDTLSLRDARIENTREDARVSENSLIHVGDGLHLVRSDHDIELDGLTLASNARVGLLFELGGGTLDSATIQDVSVRGRAGAVSRYRG